MKLALECQRCAAAHKRGTAFSSHDLLEKQRGGLKLLVQV
jgi:hypothetical protein